MKKDFKCEMCDVAFEDETQRDLHAANEKHCPQCGEWEEEVPWTAKNVWDVCELCKAERKDMRQIYDI